MYLCIYIYAYIYICVYIHIYMYIGLFNYMAVASLITSNNSEEEERWFEPCKVMLSHSKYMTIDHLRVQLHQSRRWATKSRCYSLKGAEQVYGWESKCRVEGLGLWQLQQLPMESTSLQHSPKCASKVRKVSLGSILLKRMPKTTLATSQVDLCRH